MQQYNEQFARLYMIPLVVELLTDMAHFSAPVQQADATEKSGAKGDYLQKLLAIVPERKVADLLTVEEKKRFRNEYFPVNKQTIRPFTGDTEQEEENRQAILEELMKEIQKRIQLSGVSGMKAALLPTAERSFGSDKVLTRNLYRLGWSIAMKLNKASAPPETQPPKTPKASAEPSVEEVLQIMDTLEDSGLEVVPLEPLAEEIPQQETTTAQQTQTKQQPLPPENQQSEPAKQSEWPQMVEALADGAFKIFGMAQVGKDGKVSIRVLDKDSQELEVTVNIKAAESDPNKYTFRFKGGAKNEQAFAMSGNDVRKKFTDEKTGERKSAEQVYTEIAAAPAQEPQTQELSAQQEPSVQKEPAKEEAPLPPPPLPEKPQPTEQSKQQPPQPEIPHFTPMKEPTGMQLRVEGTKKIPTETPSAETFHLEVSKPQEAKAAATVPTFQPAEQLPQRGPATAAGSQPTKEKEQTPTIPQKTAITEPTVMNKKKMVEEKPRITEEGQEVAGPGRTGNTFQTRQKKRRKKWRKRAVIAATVGGTIGTGTFAIWYPAHEALSDLAMNGTMNGAAIVHCLQTLCLT